MPLVLNDLLSSSYEGAQKSARFDWKPFLSLSVRKSIPKGTVIFDEPDCHDHIWYLERGLVKLVIFSIEGKEQCVLVVSPGDTFGEAAAFDDYPYRVTAIAQEPSVVYSIKREVLFDAMKHSSDLSLLFVRSLSRKVRNLASLIEGVTLMSARDRVMLTLLRLCGSYGQETGTGAIDLHLSHSDIAEHTSLSRVTVTRIMQDLKREHLVHNRKNHVLIERTMLRRIASSIPGCVNEP